MFSESMKILEEFERLHPQCAGKLANFSETDVWRRPSRASARCPSVHDWALHQNWTEYQ